MKKLSQEEINQFREKYKNLKLPEGINDKILRMQDYEGEFKPLKTLKEIKKELSIKDADIAVMFGYANANSYRTSKAKDKLVP